MNRPFLLRTLTRAVLALTLILLAAGAVLWAAQRPRFDLRRIVVRGELHHVSRAEIRAAIAGHLQGNFLTMRLTDAREAFETIPWVASASVRRVWPDVLVVTMVERHAIGVWDDGHVLSDEGVLFAANPEEAGLDGPQVEFSGPARLAADAVTKLRAFSAALANLHESVARIAISDRSSWTVHTASGRVLELGRDDPPGSVEGRLDAVVESFPAVLARLNGSPAYIDARYNNGFAASRTAYSP